MQDLDGWAMVGGWCRRSIPSHSIINISFELLLQSLIQLAMSPNNIDPDGDNRAADIQRLEHGLRSSLDSLERAMTCLCSILSTDGDGDGDGYRPPAENMPPIFITATRQSDQQLVASISSLDIYLASHGVSLLDSFASLEHSRANVCAAVQEIPRLLYRVSYLPDASFIS